MEDDYNGAHFLSFQAIRSVCEKMSVAEISRLREIAAPYLAYRRQLEDFQLRHFAAHCREACYQTMLSACCGFESIIIFFADQVVTFLCSDPPDIDRLLCRLKQPNRSNHCVFLGEAGCVWRVRPITCAMYLCEDAKRRVFSRNPELASVLEQFREAEKQFTRPTRPVLFDELEKAFMAYGVRTPHMWFHRSPGLLRLKQKHGVA